MVQNHCVDFPSDFQMSLHFLSKTPEPFYKTPGNPNLSVRLSSNQNQFVNPNPTVRLWIDISIKKNNTILKIQTYLWGYPEKIIRIDHLKNVLQISYFAKHSIQIAFEHFLEISSDHP